MKVLHIHRNTSIYVPRNKRTTGKELESAIQNQIDFHQSEYKFWLDVREKMKQDNKL